jgi:ankyrin repeat protein
MVGHGDLAEAGDPVAVEILGDALTQAAGKGDCTSLQHLLSTSGLLVLTGARANSALKHAAAGGHVAAMRLLLDHPSADPAAMLMHADHMGYTALVDAAMGGHVGAMHLLLDHPSADAAAMMLLTSDGAIVLTRAAWTGKVDAMFRLCSTTRLQTQQPC